MRFALVFLIISNWAWATDTSVLVYNITQDQVEYGRRDQQVRAIASVTKVMTAIVVLDQNPNMIETLKLSRRVASNLPQQQYSRRDLMTAMLVRSDNAAAETLAENYPGGRQAFISDMNRHAHQFMMQHTQFEDPTGLGRLNLSTAQDVSIMMTRALNYDMIRDTSTRLSAQFETQSRKKKRVISLPNTNQPLLGAFSNILVSKTGLTSAAGWCVSMVVQHGSERYAVVILGAGSREVRTSTAKHMINDLLTAQKNTEYPSFL